MYIAPESKVLYALANVAATSTATEPVDTKDPFASIDDLPPDVFEE